MTALAVTLTALYPILLWLGQGMVEPRWLALLLLAAALARLLSLKGARHGRALRQGRWLAVLAMLLVAAAVLANAVLPLKLYPVLVNAGLLSMFAYSLTFPPTIVERLARLQQPDLPPAAVAYTRTVTWVWCGFFVVNGTLALATTLWASDALWTLYNGVIAYLLIGLLMGGELLVRRRVQRRIDA